MGRPPFCPNKDCVLHREDLPITDWFVRKGTYITKSNAKRQRFQCRVCGRWFSSQSFHIDYYVKKHVDYFSIVHSLSEGLSMRALQRLSGFSRKTIQNRIDRVSRYCIATTLKIVRSLKVKENLAADGFESFAKSQYFPNNIHVLVGSESQFLYFFNHVVLKRKGRMTDTQKKRRQELYTHCWFPKNSIKDSFSEVIQHIKQMFFHQGLSPLHLYTDEKKEYKDALKQWAKEESPDNNDIMQTVISARKKRTKSNRLFPVNYIDRELRKDQAAFRRESTCFARNTNNALSRLNVYAAYHNFTKKYRLNGKGRLLTHAEVAGVPKHTCRTFWNGLDRGRGFRKLSFLWGFLDDLWTKKVFTPYNEINYLPKYAYV
jgi:transposase-like protein